jgi:5'-methylthioadenosine phosphorylase
MEGPAFSTRAESNVYRSWGGDIIGMTALPEAKLAREAEICYSILASSTDYDCWHESEEDVTADMIVATLLKNVEVSRTAARHALRNLPRERNCQCAKALESANWSQSSPSTSVRPLPEAVHDRDGIAR